MKPVFAANACSVGEGVEGKGHVGWEEQGTTVLFAVGFYLDLAWDMVVWCCCLGGDLQQLGLSGRCRAVRCGAVS